MALTVDQFLDIWAFTYQREKMKADLEEMLDAVGMANATVHTCYEQQPKAIRAKEDGRDEL